jgi:hypothetical protein
MSAKKRESTTETEGERIYDVRRLPKITTCSISYRQADWGPRLLISFATEQPESGAEVEWIFPIFVANIAAHEDKLGIDWNIAGFWPSIGRELQRVFSEGGVVSSLHNLDSSWHDKRGANGGMVAVI